MPLDDPVTSAFAIGSTLHAAVLGLQQCPREVAPHLRLHDLE
jgi:hypothetical protein